MQLATNEHHHGQFLSATEAKREPQANSLLQYRNMQSSHLLVAQVRPVVETHGNIWVVRAEGLLVNVVPSQIQFVGLFVFTLKYDGKRKNVFSISATLTIVEHIVNHTPAQVLGARSDAPNLPRV